MRQESRAAAPLESSAPLKTTIGVVIAATAAPTTLTEELQLESLLGTICHSIGGSRFKGGTLA